MRALAAGFDMFVPKPVEPPELVSTIGDLVGLNSQPQGRSQIYQRHSKRFPGLAANGSHAV